MLARSATERPRPRRLPFSDLPPKRIGCRVFSASVTHARQMLGEQATAFIRRLHASAGAVTSCDVRQSSDNGWHCLSIVFFYEVPAGAPL